MLTSDLNKKVVFIIGGHSGIGFSAAKAFARRRATVVVGYGHDQSQAQRACDSLSAGGGSVVVEHCDVTNEELVNAAIAHITGQFGGIDIVVNAAGTTQFIPFENLDDVTTAVWQKILNTNLVGAWTIAKAAKVPLANSSIGNLVFVGSIAGLRPSGSSIPYAVSKAALHHLVRLLAHAYGPSVRVNAVAPGTIDTPWMKGHEAMLDYARSQAILKRPGTADDVADAIVYLGTAQYTTGEILVVDGGLSLT